MFYSGIADEAGKDIETQIRAHQEIGWDHIEIRNVGKENLTSISDAEFDRVLDLLQKGGLQVSCFASRLCKQKISNPFDVDVTELRRSIPRMKRMNTPYIRIMSYPNDGWKDLEWKKEVIRRIKELSKMAEDGGITIVHENCTGWASSGPQQTLELLQEVGSPALKLVWDAGNPVFFGQNPVDYFQAVREHVVYVHVKDYKRSEEDNRAVAVFPGEGDGELREIIGSLLSRGYDGGFSIEPHVEWNEASRFSGYVEYGRRLMKLGDEVQRNMGG